MFIALNEFSTDIKIFFYKDKLFPSELTPGQINPLWGIAIVVLLYLLFVVLINSTKIKVSAEKLEVKRGPIYVPFLKSFSMLRGEIQRIDLLNEDSGRVGGSCYQIVAAAANGRTYNILSLDTRDKAVHVAQFLQNILLLKTDSK
jgi:hypothetical protein